MSKQFGREIRKEMANCKNDDKLLLDGIDEATLQLN